MALLEWALTGVHDVSGLPWWATIALTTASVRLALLPVQIYQSKSIAKLQAIKPQMDRLTAEMKEGWAQLKDDPDSASGGEKAQKAQMEYNALIKKHSVRPFAPILGAVFQVPLWATFFFTMRHLTRPDAALGMETGGLLWFSDLTATDPYYALPSLCGATFFAMVHVGDAGQAQGQELNDQVGMQKKFMKGFAVAMVPLTAWMSSGVFIYWIANNLAGVSQTLLLRQPAVRQLTGMPPLPGSAQFLAADPVLQMRTAALLGGSKPPPQPEALPPTGQQQPSAKQARAKAPSAKKRRKR